MTTKTEPRKLRATELRELKSLIKSNFNILKTELNYRLGTFESAIGAEKKARQQAAIEEFEKAVRSIDKRIASVNEAITKIVNSINEKGVITVYSRGYGNETSVTKQLRANDFHVTWNPPTNTLVVGGLADLEEANLQIHREHYAAMRELDRMEYDQQKDLVLDYITTDIAVEHVQALPSVENLINTPKVLEGTPIA